MGFFLTPSSHHIIFIFSIQKKIKRGSNFNKLNQFMLRRILLSSIITSIVQITAYILIIYLGSASTFDNRLWVAPPCNQCSKCDHK
jgi:hypothetical protein